MTYANKILSLRRAWLSILEESDDPTKIKEGITALKVRKKTAWSISSAVLNGMFGTASKKGTLWELIEKMLTTNEPGSKKTARKMISSTQFWVKATKMSDQTLEFLLRQAFESSSKDSKSKVFASLCVKHQATKNLKTHISKQCKVATWEEVKATLPELCTESFLEQNIDLQSHKKTHQYGATLQTRITRALERRAKKAKKAKRVINRDGSDAKQQEEARQQEERITTLPYKTKTGVDHEVTAEFLTLDYTKNFSKIPAKDYGEAHDK